MAQKDCKSCKWYHTDVDLPWAVCRLHEFHFEHDYTPCEEYEEKVGSSGRAGSSESGNGCGTFIIIAIILYYILYYIIEYYL